MSELPDIGPYRIRRGPPFPSFGVMVMVMVALLFLLSRVFR